MNKIKTFLSITIISLALGCNNESRFPMEKRYWTVEDYDDVIREIDYNTPKDERLPEFANSETSAVITKLIDTENFKVILNDEELGLNHRSNVSEKFFMEYKDLANAYNVLDRKDNFIYGPELIEILKFGLELQLVYFELGNRNIKSTVDDPNASEVRELIRSNEKVIFANFNNYLDFVNKENSFSPEVLSDYAEGIDIYFSKLYETFPKGNKRIILKKAELMLKKSQHSDVKKSLEKLIEMSQ